MATAPVFSDESCILDCQSCAAELLGTNLAGSFFDSNELCFDSSACLSCADCVATSSTSKAAASFANTAKATCFFNCDIVRPFVPCSTCPAFCQGSSGLAVQDCLCYTGQETCKY